MEEGDAQCVGGWMGGWEVDNGSVVKALGSYPCGCGFKSHQVQVYFHQTLHLSPPAYPAINSDMAFAGDGQDHWPCFNQLRAR